MKEWRKNGEGLVCVCVCVCVKDSKVKESFSTVAYTIHKVYVFSDHIHVPSSLLCLSVCTCVCLKLYIFGSPSVSGPERVVCELQ